jgi:ketosteroid isomerase-like protein
MGCSALALFVAVLPVCAQSAVETLVSAERAFARDAQERTVAAAFISAFAEEGILFRQEAVNARASVRARPMPDDLLLEWEPEYAEVAASGDFGYTTGPWSAGRRGQDERSGFGRFVTVWKHDGKAWQAYADIGISHPGPRPEAVLETRPAAATQAAPEHPAQHTDDALNTRIAAAGAGALTEVLAADARVFRDGILPLKGTAPADSVARTFTRLGGDTATSGDLAYAYGSWRGDGNARGHYLRVWRNEAGTWRVALDLVTKVTA